MTGPSLEPGQDSVDLETLAQGLDECFGPQNLLTDAEVEELSQARHPAGVVDPVTLLDAHELRTWVDWLRSTYPVHDRIPERWAELPAVLAELHGLHVSHVATTSGDGAGLLDWHEALQRALERIGQWVTAARRAKLLRKD